MYLLCFPETFSLQCQASGSDNVNILFYNLCVCKWCGLLTDFLYEIDQMWRWRRLTLLTAVWRRKRKAGVRADGEAETAPV